MNQENVIILNLNNEVLIDNANVIYDDYLDLRKKLLKYGLVLSVTKVENAIKVRMSLKVDRDELEKELLPTIAEEKRAQKPKEEKILCFNCDSTAVHKHDRKYLCSSCMFEHYQLEHSKEGKLSVDILTGGITCFK